MKRDTRCYHNFADLVFKELKIEFGYEPQGDFKTRCKKNISVFYNRNLEAIEQAENCDTLLYTDYIITCVDTIKFYESNYDWMELKKKL